jgi:hypothetical protein
MDDLKARILADRLASFERLKGGFPIPLAGAIYWAALTWVGYTMPPGQWILVAMWGSGAIFPIALLLAKLFRNDFMKDQTATGDVLLPTFISMFLFWPMLISAIWSAPQLAPLILAIGMSLHWPVIGWAYGKTALYTAHAVVRAIVVFIIWNWMPEARFTLLPLSVSVIYLLTVVAIVVSVSRNLGTSNAIPLRVPFDTELGGRRHVAGEGGGRHD